MMLGVRIYEDSECGFSRSLIVRRSAEKTVEDASNRWGSLGGVWLLVNWLVLILVNWLVLIVLVHEDL